MPHSPSILFILLAFALLLAPLVVIHELGHYLVGRWCGVQAQVFSVGFGREIWGRTDRYGTRWKLSMLPLGGYVMFAGDANATSMPLADDGTTPSEARARWLQNRPLWQRALVVVAGPAANFLLALLIFTGFILAHGQSQTPPVIASLVAHSPARAAGLQLGDRITAIDGSPVASFEEIRPRVLPMLGEPLRITAERQGRSFTLAITPMVVKMHDAFGNEERIALLGIGFAHPRVVRVPVWRALQLATDQCFGMMRLMVTGIRQVATGTRSVQEMGGPIKIAQAAGQQMTLGWQPFAYFAGFVSINLAFINLLPIPGLDGGHLLLYAAEAIRRKPLDAQKQEWALRAGMALVLGLMLFVTMNDIGALRIFGG